MKTEVCASGAKWEIHFCVRENGECPVRTFLESLEADEQHAFHARFDRMVEGPSFAPSNTFKALRHVSNVFEVLTHKYRVLGFRDGRRLILTNGFTKTRNETLPKEIQKCESIREQYGSDVRKQ